MGATPANPPPRLAATYNAASHGARAQSCAVSSEKALKVVKPPSKPVTSNSRASSRKPSETRTPMAVLPAAFTASVPHGKPVPIAAVAARATK